MWVFSWNEPGWEFFFHAERSPCLRHSMCLTLDVIDPPFVGKQCVLFSFAKCQFSMHTVQPRTFHVFPRWMEMPAARDMLRRTYGFDCQCALCAGLHGTKLVSKQPFAGRTPVF